MKHFVFIVTGYYPNYSGNGRCIKNIIDSLESEIRVTVISQNTTGDLCEREIVNGTIIHRITTPRLKRKLHFKNKLGSHNIIKKNIVRIIYESLRISDALQTIFSSTSIKNDLKNSYVRALSKIDESIDIIFPCCYPMESVLAAQEYSKNQIPVIPFLIDKFADSMNLHKASFNKSFKYNRHLTIEKNIIANSKMVFYHNSWRNHLLEDGMLSSKLVNFELPLIQRLESDTKTFTKNANAINLSYAGLLDYNVRPATYFIQLVKIFYKRNINYVFHVMATGNYDSKLRELENHCSSIFNYYGRRPNNEAVDMMINSDVLLSIGNLDISQFASKIFEYVSTGKLIIHLYNDEKDPVLDILKKYPLALCIDQKAVNPERAIELIIDFVNVNKSKYIEFKNIENIYYNATPQHVINSIKTSLIKEGYYD